MLRSTVMLATWFWSHYVDDAFAMLRLDYKDRPKNYKDSSNPNRRWPRTRIGQQHFKIVVSITCLQHPSQTSIEPLWSKLWCKPWCIAKSSKNKNFKNCFRTFLMVWFRDINSISFLGYDFVTETSKIFSFPDLKF